ncbi:hypothetical protein HNV11_03215 [Spirosoma taeanense]|uniref:HMA domain-containing protein n=1 Tax=Spirosoma taeanense TaxID=2735870 RepID=A0A6M5Y5G6_9BACT|nr:hypothetical protein [Spirosoma taeanense]QJW88451.1 hypothetical protein HNV11_03215 [Spirosoma taeanense]
MVEVFKTDVRSPTQAKRLIDQIHSTYTSYQANFDLDDCDRVLRVECPSGVVESTSLITLLRAAGFGAEILPDDVPASEPIVPAGSLFTC